MTEVLTVAKRTALINRRMIKIIQPILYDAVESLTTPRTRGSTSAPKLAKVLWKPDKLPAVSGPNSLGIMVNEGLRTKLINHPKRKVSKNNSPLLGIKM